jgi:hypothetical protein
MDNVVTADTMNSSNNSPLGDVGKCSLIVKIAAD